MVKVLDNRENISPKVQFISILDLTDFIQDFNIISLFSLTIFYFISFDLCIKPLFVITSGCRARESSQF